MEWKPAEGDMPRVTFRTNINVLNIILVILIITINDYSVINKGYEKKKKKKKKNLFF